MAFEWFLTLPNYLVFVCVILLCIAKKYFAGGVCQSTNRIDGKTVIITGANSGIGKETAVDLAKRGGRVIMACRDMEKGQIAIKEVIQKSRNTNVYLKKLDLSSLASVRSFVADILKTETRLDILINNAGQGYGPRTTTEDGFEMLFAVNHLSHFLLTNLLLDLLKKSAPSRIINVSSIFHRNVDEINFDDINGEKKYFTWNAYSQSKLANVLFTRELAHRLKDDHVTAYSLHPGFVNTNISQKVPLISVIKILLFPIIYIFFKTPQQGAQTSIHLAVADVQEHNGLYFADCTVTKVSKAGEDDGMAKKLWEISAEMVGL